MGQFNQSDAPLKAHRLSFLFELLQVLGEIDANAHHHVLSNQLPLPRIVTHLIQDVQKGLVAGQPTIKGKEEEKGLEMKVQ